MWVLLVCGLCGAAMLCNWWRSGQPFFDYLEQRTLYGFTRVWHRCSMPGPNTLPRTGPAILIANHSSHADPGFLIASSPRKLHFLQARECYEVFLLRRLFRLAGCIPIARDGHDVTGLRLALRRLAEGVVVCIFPEGEVCPAGRGRLAPGKPGVALLALRSRAPVIPALVTGGPQTTVMLWAWLWPSRGVRVTYGPPIDLSAYYGRRIDRKLLDEVTALLMQRIADLGKRQRADPGIGREQSLAG